MSTPLVTLSSPMITAPMTTPPMTMVTSTPLATLTQFSQLPYSSQVPMTTTTFTPPSFSTSATSTSSMPVLSSSTPRPVRPVVDAGPLITPHYKRSDMDFLGEMASASYKNMITRSEMIGIIMFG
ncbi:hypothetical protein M9H77_18348 [Catharanthus roseus]|uniref:Uncharacterized protein n=1 Tax=Catharanthus roseus TaxID=4058 RepID=A0ACC0B775_CATRO|nr:hypothetical protein M9H77_18348 [Catharanthus roseus]